MLESRGMREGERESTLGRVGRRRGEEEIGSAPSLTELREFA